ncbi:uncharacterized protein [Littorina saxatilis]|uniref:uncharacterized protein n=1 Tax=Littorina saxatilis TaxID=31220 RepID=UPI0038B6943B
MGKKYSQSSNYSTQDRPSNAANGNTSGLYDANNCIHTLPAQQGTHWWQVDLGGTYPVYNITVWGRANYWNSLNSRLYPFTITVDGQTCVSVTSAAGTRENSVTCSSVMYGRVVRLNVTMPGQMLNLCEFQISICKEGFYGLDCSTSCDTNCDGRCNRITGHCTRQNSVRGLADPVVPASAPALTGYQGNGNSKWRPAEYHYLWRVLFLGDLQHIPFILLPHYLAPVLSARQLACCVSSQGCLSPL